MKVLIIEDKKQLADAIHEYLKMHKVDSSIKLDGLEGFDEAATGLYDVIILDLMLPSKDGISIIKDLRAKKVETPIIILTAKATTDDKVEGLLAGADDYLTKPFVLEELLARLYVLTRRKGNIVPNLVAFGDIKLDKLNHTIVKDPRTIALSLKEYLIMELLITNTDKIVEKSYILDRVWGYDSDSFYNSVEVYVSFLRKKLQSINANVKIKSIRNVGYKLMLNTQDDEEGEA
ncbi:MAG: response regulator transcription factor [Bacilli bacterium]|jgi:DNA-binding response OmpR family regulator